MISQRRLMKSVGLVPHRGAEGLGEVDEQWPTKVGHAAYRKPCASRRVVCHGSKIVQVTLDTINDLIDLKASGRNILNRVIFVQRDPKCGYDLPPTRPYVSTEGSATETVEFSVRDAIAELQALGFEFRESGKTMAFLRKYRGLITRLFDAKKLIDRFFPDSRITLEVVSDPEIKDYDQLVVYVKHEMPPREAFETLRKLDHEWLKSGRRNDKLLIHLEMP